MAFDPLVIHNSTGRGRGIGMKVEAPGRGSHSVSLEGGKLSCGGIARHGDGPQG